MTVTVSVFPAPPAPGALAHEIDAPPGVAQVATSGSSGTSPWVCAFFSWTALAVIPAMSVGCVAP